MTISVAFQFAIAFAILNMIGKVFAYSRGITVNPYIEYYANLPERWLGVFGIGLILWGFALQSLRYSLTLLDVHVA
jgi:hypothetical protein